MEFFDYSFRDLNRKIDGTIFLREGEPWLFRQIYDRGDVESSREVVVGQRIHNGMWEQQRHPYSIMDQIEFYQPLLGYVNHNGCAYYMIRTVSKQYMLGFNVNNYIIGKGFEIDRTTIARGKFHLRGVNDAAFINSVVHRRFFTFSEVMNKITRGELLSGAITTEVAINQSRNFNYPLISYKDKVVGYVDTRSTPRSYLFSPAEYVERILPFPVTIKENNDDLVSRY